MSTENFQEMKTLSNIYHAEFVSEHLLGVHFEEQLKLLDFRTPKESEISIPGIFYGQFVPQNENYFLHPEYVASSDENHLLALFDIRKLPHPVLTQQSYSGSEIECTCGKYFITQTAGHKSLWNTDTLTCDCLLISPEHPKDIFQLKLHPDHIVAHCEYLSGIQAIELWNPIL